VAPPGQVWDAEVLSRVRHLHLRARVLTDSLMTGEHRSRRVGQAVEFADYQEYVPGMDLRRLDWRVLARADRLVVRRYETETELPCAVVLDLSGDLSTGRTGRSGYPDLDKSKAGYAIVLAATLLYFLHRHGEPIGLELIAGSAGNRSYKPRKGKNQLQRLFLELASAKPGGVADLQGALIRVGGPLRRRSWVTVISDGMEEPSAWLPSLGAFAKRGADLTFVHTFDRGELRLEVPGPSVFFSPETNAELPLDPFSAKAAFAEVVRDYMNEVKSGVVRWGGRYVQAPSDRPLDELIRTLIVGHPLAEAVAWA
jgi:uncharacterized protein (DUF58 family)